MNKVKKKNKKKNQRKIFLLLLLLVMTGIILGTSTYAWFTANKTVTINPIDVNVEAKSGLQISANGTTWQPTLQNSDITGASTAGYGAAVNQMPAVIEPVSTAGAVDSNGKMEMYLGEVSASGDSFVLSSTKSNETNTTASGSFVAFDVFLKTETTTPVYLTTNSGVAFKDAQDNGIKNATRIAFVKLGHIESGASASSIQSLNAGEVSPVKIWEPNYDSHTANGVANASDPYGVTGLTAGTGNTLVPYSGIKAEFGADSNISLGGANATDQPNYFETVTPTLTTIADFADYVKLDDFQAGITKLRIYMWIEGQDVDCENNASGGNIEFNVQFSTNSSAN